MSIEIGNSDYIDFICAMPVTAEQIRTVRSTSHPPRMDDRNGIYKHSFADIVAVSDRYASEWGHDVCLAAMCRVEALATICLSNNNADRSIPEHALLIAAAASPMFWDATLFWKFEPSRFYAIAHAAILSTLQNSDVPSNKRNLGCREAEPFSWNAKSTVIPAQDAVSAYINADGQVHIRQQGRVGDVADTTVIVQPYHLSQLIRKLKELVELIGGVE